MKTLIFVLTCATWLMFPYSAAMAEDDGGMKAAKYALIGDSQGANLKRELWFKAKDAGCSFETKTEVGTRAVGWTDSRKMRAWLKSYDPDVVLVSFGTNEAKYDTPVPVLARQFQAFADRVSNRGKRRVIWLAPPTLPGVDYLANVRSALLTVKGIEIVDLSENEYAVNDSLYHLTRAAYIMWAWDIWGWIQEHSTIAVAKR